MSACITVAVVIDGGNLSMRTVQQSAAGLRGGEMDMRTSATLPHVSDPDWLFRRRQKIKKRKNCRLQSSGGLHIYLAESRVSLSFLGDCRESPDRKKKHFNRWFYLKLSLYCATFKMLI